MSDIAKLTPAACRAARGLLNWSVAELARKAGVSPNTVVKVESEKPGVRPIGPEPEARIIAAFARERVEITNGNGTGARLRQEGS